MNFIKTLLLITLVSGAYQLNAQLKVDVPTEFYRNILRDGDLPANVQGTPYFEEEFKPGKIYIKDSEPFSAMIRYDAYRDNLEMKDGDKNTSLLKRDYITAAIANEKIKIFKYKTDSEDIREGYFYQLTDGNLKLLKRKRKIFKSEEKNSSTYKKDEPARLVDEVDFYLVSNDYPAQKIKLRKKNVLKALELEDGSEATKIVKQRKMKLSDENEVIQLIQLLNNSTDTSK